MTLPASGAISSAMIATELGRAGTAVSMNDADVRALAGKATGAVSLSDLLGKASIAGSTIVAGSSVMGVETVYGYNSGSPAMGSLTVGGHSLFGSLVSFISGSSGTPGWHVVQAVFSGNHSAALADLFLYIDGVKLPTFGRSIDYEGGYTMVNHMISGAPPMSNGNSYLITLRNS